MPALVAPRRAPRWAQVHQFDAPQQSTEKPLTARYRCRYETWRGSGGMRLLSPSFLQ